MTSTSETPIKKDKEVKKPVESKKPNPLDFESEHYNMDNIPKDYDHG